jgi:hypothetical protein
VTISIIYSPKEISNLSFIVYILYQKKYAEMCD